MGKFKRLKNPSLQDLLKLQGIAQYGELKGVTVGDDVYFWNEVEDNHHADQYHTITRDPDAALYTFSENFEKHRLTLMPVREDSHDPTDLALVNGHFKNRSKAVEAVKILLSNKHLRDYVLKGNMYIDNPAFYLSGGPPYIKARAYVKEHPITAAFMERKFLTKADMIKQGADGYLSRAVKCMIPVDKIDGLEPVPAASEGDPYIKGKPIKQPVEVQYQRDKDVYILYSGNHRVHQAKLNGDKYIPAFVEPDGGKIGLHVKPYTIAASGVLPMHLHVKDNRYPAISIAERVHIKVMAGEARTRLATVKRRTHELPRFKIKQRPS